MHHITNGPTATKYAGEYQLGYLTVHRSQSLPLYRTVYDITIIIRQCWVALGVTDCDNSDFVQ